MEESMLKEMNQAVPLKAPVLKRIAAFLIDAVVAFIPVLVMYLVFTGSYVGWTPIWYESPAIAAVSMIDLPEEVNEKLNTFDNEDGGTYRGKCLQVSVSFCYRVLCILFYILCLYF